MRIHEISFSEIGVVNASLFSQQQPLTDSSIFSNGMATAILIFVVLDPTNNVITYINHISPQFQQAKFLPPEFLSQRFLQDVPIIKENQPRIEYFRLEEGRLLGARHLFVAFFSKSYFDQTKPNDKFLTKLFGRMSYDITEYQIKTLVMDQLVLPYTKEYYEWNKVLRDGAIWRNALTSYIYSVDILLVVCPLGMVWDNYMNEAKTKSTVMSYNVLAQSYTSKHYDYCKQHIGFQVRTPKIVNMVNSIHADIQLYQEMEKAMLDNLMRSGPFHSHFKTKEGRKEGLAILIDKRIWEVVGEGIKKLSLDHPQEMIFVVCKHKFTQQMVLVVCTHLIGDPNLLDIQKEQAELLVNLSNMTALEHGCQNIIIGGDFNAGNQSEAYKELEKSGFKSLLKEIHGTEPAITFNTDKIHRSIDYLWSNFQTIKPCTSSTFDQEQFEIRMEQALPNAEHGSDHIPIYGKLSLDC